MFIGHYAVALAAKKASPRTSLGTLFIATQFVDLLWPLFLLFGVEHVRIAPGDTIVTPLDFYDYPYTHSLLAVGCWGILIGILYFVVRREVRGAVVVSLCVFSHWLLDLIAHRPDLPVGLTGDTRLGLGLWNSLAGTLLVESALFTGGVALYIRSTKGRNRRGTAGFWVLVAALYAIYIVNLFGPPPPSVQMIAVAGNLAWVFVFWAYWVDRNREMRGEEIHQ